MNVLNEMYLRDQSKKMRACYWQKGNIGLPTNNLCMYDYCKDSEDKNHWLIDDEVAAVVKRIFQLAIDCHGPYDITRILSEDKVECPAYYNAIHENCMRRSNTDMSKPYAWNGATVSNILRQPEYMGHTINFRSIKNGLKAKRQNKPREEWMIFKNTHDAIILQDEWELAQYVLHVRRRTDSTGEANPLTGKLFCAECGALLNNHHSKRKNANRASDDYYDCLNYSQGKGDCSCHYITTAFIRSVLLQTIRAVSQYAISDEAAFAEQVRSLSALRHADVVKEKAKGIKQAKKRIAELDVIIQKPYEAYALGKTSENRFEVLSTAYEKEQSELKAVLAQNEAALSDYNADSSNIERFMALARKYRDVEELTAPVINSFIDKIIVHAPKKINGQRCMQIEIIFHFIGNFAIPQLQSLSTEDELRMEDKRVQERERNHRKYLRRKERKKQTLIAERATA